MIYTAHEIQCHVLCKILMHRSIIWSLHQTWVPNSKLTSYTPHICTYMYNKKTLLQSCYVSYWHACIENTRLQVPELTMRYAGCSLPVQWNDLGMPWGPERPACKPSTGCATEREGHKGRCVLDNSGKWRAFSERRVYKHWVGKGEDRNSNDKVRPHVRRRVCCLCLL